MTRHPGTTDRGARGLGARRADGPDERGATLILALMLLLFGVILIGALSYEVAGDLHSSTRFAAVRSQQYAAKSATNLAIENIRYTPMLTSTLNASPPVACWGTGSISETASIDGTTPMAAWCSTVWAPTSASTRTVTIATCPATEAATSCAAAPLLQAVVVFDDYPPGVSAPSTQQCVEYCGTSMQIQSWQWEPTVPTVTSVSPASGPISGGTSVTVTGTGFVPGSSVDFVAEGSSTTSNVVVPAASTTVSGLTSLTAVSPAVTKAGGYYVVVTTPAGSSAFGGNVFTYTAFTPTVSTLAANQGSIAGGSSVTVTGTGFLQGASVKFVPESGGVATSGGTTLLGAYVDVLSSTTLTVVTPGVISVGTYFVEVTTTAGTSPTSANDVYTFSYLVPTVSAVSPSSGPDAGGTAITITGTGFITGASVSFVKESSGCSSVGAIAAKSVVVVSSSTITAASPSVSAAAPYYVYVTTTSGSSSYSSSCYPIFNYTG